MININKVVLVGRITKDPELRKTQSNTSVCQFTLAIDRRFSKSDEADFISCVAWKQPAEYLAQYAYKGTIVSVEGRIQTRTYEGNNGTVYITEVIADSVQMIAQQMPKKEKEDTSKFGGYASNSAEDIVESNDLPFY